MNKFTFSRAQAVPEAVSTVVPSSQQYPESSALGSVLKRATDKQNAPLKRAINPMETAPMPSPQIKETPKETGVVPISPNGTDNQKPVVKSAIFDVSRGMPMEKFSELYPELADQRDVFESLKNDLWKGMPKEKIPELYPELYETPSFAQEAGQFAKGAFEKTGEAFKWGWALIKEAVEWEGYSLPERGVRAAVGWVRAITSPLAGLGGQIAEGSIEEMKKGDDWRQRAAEAITPAVQKYQEFKAGMTPEQSRQFENISLGTELLTAGLIPKGTGIAAPTVESGISATKTGLGQAIKSTGETVKTGLWALKRTPKEVAPAKNVFGEVSAPVEIEQPGILGKAVHKIADALPGEKDVGRLVNDALKTKQRGATPKDRLAKISSSGYVDDLETLHGIVSSGKIEADLNTVFGGAEAVQKGLQHYGQKIGQALKDSGLDSKVDVGTAISKIDNILADAREALANPAMIALAKKYKQLLTDFPELENIQKTKQDIFQDLGNIRKENVGRQSYRDFSDAAQELITAIDKKVEQATSNSAEFINDKKIYKSLKNIEKDITDSAIVAQRGSQQRMVEQLADLQIGLDAVKNPLGAVTAKMGRDVAKAIADRNSRDGSFRRAMEVFNERAKKRGDISAKIEKRPESAPLKGTASTLKRKEAPAPRSLDSIIKETEGVDMDKYLSNASEASANKMADHAYKYAIDSAVEGKNTLNFDKIAKIGEAIESGKEGKIGTVGDMIKDSYLRKLYKDALDTPIEVVKGTGTEGSVGEFVISGPKKGTIIFRTGNEGTTYNLADTILHEAAHSIRLKKGRVMDNDYVKPLTRTPKAKVDILKGETKALQRVIPSKSENQPLSLTSKKSSSSVGSVTKPTMKNTTWSQQLTGLHKIAQKYKTKEDFINALDIAYEDSWAWSKASNADEIFKEFKWVIFHGTNASENIQKTWYKIRNEWNSWAYFADTPDRAISYMKQNRSTGGKSPDVLVNDISNLKIKEWQWEVIRNISKMNTGMEEYVASLKKQGYDWIKDSYWETLIWNVGKIKTPKTLTQIYEESKAATKPKSKPIGIKKRK